MTSTSSGRGCHDGLRQRVTPRDRRYVLSRLCYHGGTRKGPALAQIQYAVLIGITAIETACCHRLDRRTAIVSCCYGRQSPIAGVTGYVCVCHRAAAVHDCLIDRLSDRDA